MFMGYYVYSQYIPAKEPIEGTYEVSDYVLDETNYLWNPDLLQEGLEYFEEKSNVQIVVMTSSNVFSQDEADDIYNVLFDDAAHALIIIPTEWYNGSKIYYSIGGIAAEVIDGSTMDYLIKQVDDYKEGEDWQAALYDVTDKLIVEK
jgi:hypothetical protein